MIELKVSDIESVYVDCERILFIKSTPVGVLVALNVNMPTPYPVEVMNTAQELMDAIDAERKLTWTQIGGDPA